MIQGRKKTAYTVFLAVVILITMVFSTISYGWLVNYIHGDFGFSAKELPPFTLQLAKIPASATEALTEESRAYQTITKYIEANEDGSHLDVNLGNMSFGAIDNVAQLKNENVVYLRLTVPKSLGDTVKLNLHYSADDFIVLYKNVYNGDTVTGTEEVTNAELINSLLGIETNADIAKDVKLNSYLLYDAMVSNVDYQASQIAENFVSSLKTEQTAETAEQTVAEETYQKFVNKTTYGTDFATYTQTLVNPNYSSVADDGNYYVYIKVVPNLALFAYCIEYISDIMPCYMYFKICATFESGPLPSQENSAA